jgi:uncharacterized protein YbaR (Trm112 family)
MIAVCEECGAVYDVRGELPVALKCTCNSKRFKVIEEISY